MIRGTIFDIQKFALHNGPGIRTTVFFKGCPLKCSWCHNPESLSPLREITFFPKRCLNCGACRAQCPQRKDSDAVGPLPEKFRCQLCGACVIACPSEALEINGTDITVNEVMNVLEKDSLFYDESGGGVTFSGGEPLMQPDFLLDLLKSCKNKGWHTAVDTCGYAPEKTLQDIMFLTDLFLFDLKHMDDECHRDLTGVSNQLIFKNLEMLASIGKEIHIRVPVIPGLNDDIAHYHKLGRYLQELDLSILHLLPYHGIGADKYTRQGMNYQLSGVKSPSQDQLCEIAALLSTYHLQVIQGG